jgi:hypothetical protein
MLKHLGLLTTIALGLTVTTLAGGRTYHGIRVNWEGPIYQAYSGTPLPRDQIAVLRLKGKWMPYNIQVTVIDGKSTCLKWDGSPFPYSCAGDLPPVHGKTKVLAAAGSIELLPGNHSITFVAGDFAKYGDIDEAAPRTPMTVAVSVEAGKTYRATMKMQKVSSQNLLVITPTINVGNQVETKVKWSVEITENK